MLETAALFIAMAIGKKVLDHVGDDAGDAFDASLRKLARWVREKVASRPAGNAAIEIIAGAPAGDAGVAIRDSGRKMLTGVLEEITTGDSTAASELQSLVTEVEQHAPSGLVVDNHVVVREVTGGSVTGVEAIGLPGGTRINSDLNIGTAQSTTIIGTRIEGGR
jgi:hypothetical protein